MLLSTLYSQARRTVPQILEADSPLRDPTISVPLDDILCYVAYLLDSSMAALIAAPYRQGAPHILSGKKPTKRSVIEGATQRCCPFSGVHNLASESTSKIIARSCRPASLCWVSFLGGIGTFFASHCITLHCTTLRCSLSVVIPSREQRWTVTRLFETPGLGNADHDSKRAQIPHCMLFDHRPPSYPPKKLRRLRM